MDELAAFARRLAKLEDADTLKRIAAKAGVAGKQAALDAAAKSLGGDRKMSNKRGGALNAGYDEAGGSSVQINFRPAGLWMLAQEGRRKSGPIRPKGVGRRRGMKRALRTPNGPRAASSYGPSRGLGTFDDAVRQAQRDVPKAAAAQFTDEIKRILR